MEEVLYEIVMLPNGEVVLQRSNSKDSPLVKIVFSKEARQLLGDQQLTIAKEMIDAGLDAVQDLDLGSSQSLDGLEESDRVLH